MNNNKIIEYLKEYLLIITFKMLNNFKVLKISMNIKTIKTSNNNQSKIINKIK